MFSVPTSNSKTDEGALIGRSSIARIPAGTIPLVLSLIAHQKRLVLIDSPRTGGRDRKIKSYCNLIRRNTSSIWAKSSSEIFLTKVAAADSSSCGYRLSSILRKLISIFLFLPNLQQEIEIFAGRTTRKMG